jgi:hypothetical protein
MRAGEGRAKLAHRLSFEIHNGPIPAGMCVCHKCDTPSCVNPEHLFLATNEANTADRVRKGRSRGGRAGARNPVKGSAHHQAKLNEQQVAAVRLLLRLSNHSQRAIAAMFRVSQPTISAIKNRRNWYEGRRTRAALANVQGDQP